jgi:hypothetical protein
VLWHQQLQGAELLCDGEERLRRANACKGQGWLKVSLKECLAKGGRILPDKI